MAIKPFNSVAGFSVGEVPANVVLANGDIITGNIQANANIIANGNITANFFLGNGAYLTGIDATGIQNGNSNVKVYANANVTISSAGNANIAIVTGTGLVVAGTFSASGNATSGNLSTVGNVNTGNLIATGLLSVIGNANVGNIGAYNGTFTTITGTLTTNAQPNITSVGALVDLSIIGNANIGNIGSAGVITAIGNIGAGNISTTGLITVSGNANVGNLGTGGFITAIGNITGSNLITAGNVTTANATVNLELSGNTANFTGNVYAPNFIGNVVGNISGNIVIPGANTGVVFNDQGNANTSTAFTFNKISNAVSISGNITAANISTGGNVQTENIVNPTANTSIGMGNGSGILVLTSAGNSTQFAPSGQITLGGASQIVGGTFGGSGLTLGGSQTDIFQNRGGNVTVQVGTGGSIANTWTFAQSGAFIAPGAVSATGNITGGNLTTAGLITATGNITGGNLTTAGLITATGNITGGNLTTGGSLSVTGNANVGNLGATNLVSTIVTASGNITGGNLRTDGVIAVYGTDDSLIAGNLNITGKWINNVGYPVLVSDAASKQYVDTMISSGITYHEPVNVATTTTLAVATGGTTSYVSPNGAANGIGAYISTTGTYLNIDGANVQTVGTRILVKDEANATWNGIYTYANTTAIVRSTDADQYGSNSTEEISINDYFFTQTGTVNKGIAFIVSAPAGTIIFGTSNITFSIFSGSQVYTAGTGIDITGTVISANASQTQITAVGSLTTLSVVGNANIGNIGTGVVTATGNGTFANISTAGLITATGNITGANIITGGLITASGNVTGGNLTTAGLITATGNITGGNLTTAGLITATGNITGANVLTAGIVSATGNGTFGNISTTGSGGNITGANVVSANTFSASSGITSTGNVSGANLVASSGVYGVTANFTGNLTSLNANLGNLATANFVNVSSNLNVIDTANVGNLRTDHLLYANGQPWDLQEAAGSNRQIQFNDGSNNFAANANLTYDYVTSNLSVVGNVIATNFVGNIIGNISGNIVIPGSNTGVVFNDNGNANTSTAFTFNKVSNVVALAGNLNVGNTTIAWGTATTSNVDANQTITQFSTTGIAAMEFLVKGIDSTGSKYSVSTVTAITNGSTVDYSTYATAFLNSTTGSLSVNIVGSNVALQVTPASSNSTVWTTQVRFI